MNPFSTIDLLLELDVDKMSISSSCSPRKLSRSPETPFSTARLLVGDFDVAHALLIDLVGEYFEYRRLKPRLRFVVRPLAICHRDISPIETRILRELTLGAGSRHTVVTLDPTVSVQSMEKLFKIDKARSG